ncbi:hypothetical protein GGR52DRAFT_501815 [Hypoxylon sp. FL1284]|nr:hypothetical protein GGR52DRAFT_501815 [Hypoxylon sp. FL1284]
MQLHAHRAHLTVFLLSLQTRLAASYDTTPHIWPLDPWRISQLRITAPAPGRSGTVDIGLAIENPNTVSAGPAPHAAGGGYLPFAPSAANCTLAEVPSESGSTELLDTAVVCNETTEFSYGVWTVTSASASDAGFDLAFRLSYNVSRWGGILYKVYDGTAQLEVGQDLTEGVCDDAADKCEFALAPGSDPVLVAPTMTDCKGYCQMPSNSTGE